MSLADTLSAFFESLDLGLDSGVDRRVAALEALASSDGGSGALGVGSAVRAGSTLTEALAAAVRICPEVLICSGSSPRCRLTLGPLVEHLALPVVLLEELDGGEPPRSLGAGLERLLAGSSSADSTADRPKHQPQAAGFVLPRLVVVQTSLKAFEAWLPGAIGEHASGEDSVSAMIQALREVTEGDRVPGLAALGFVGPWPGRWILDGGAADAIG